MGALSQNEQRKLAYFHTLGKVMTENTQDVYESKYKSSHNIRFSDIWLDDITYAENYMTAYAESLTNSAITLYENVKLNMIYGSNGQSYVYIKNGTFKDITYPISERGQITSGGTFIKPFISPTDISHIQTNEPSNGYELKLYRGSNATNGTPNSQIYVSEGSWCVDYNAGIIHFSEGYTPSNLGWGDITATFFQYSGNFGNITNIGGIQSVTYDINTQALIFDQGRTFETTISLSSLKQKIANNNLNMIANVTNSANTLACNVPISGNIVGGLRVSVNGIDVTVGVDCYFTDPTHTIIRNNGEEILGDFLHWKYVSTPISGYDLNITDNISFLYLI